MLLTVPSGSKGCFPKGKLCKREGKDTRLAKQKMTTKILFSILKMFSFLLIRKSSLYIKNINL